MIRKLFPLIMLILGSGVGVGAGIFLRPATVAVATEEPPGTSVAIAKKPEEPASEREYMKMNNQFVVPVVKDDQIAALVVLSLSLEVPAGGKDKIYAKEPRLRDSFLQVLFDHANIGGFDGAFTNVDNLAVLRNALKEVAQKDMGDNVSDVLIVEIAKQNY